MRRSRELHFGYPYCHGGDIPDPEFGKKRSCSEFTAPAQKLGPHVAALGMRFYTGSMFPSEYKNQIFIAEHGSWNRSTPIGYRVTLVQLQGNRPYRTRLSQKDGCKEAEHGAGPSMCSLCPTAPCSCPMMKPALSIESVTRSERQSRPILIRAA
jgi:Glucose/sorbosone dehydrogenases